ncbi:Protocadherin Fat 3 [Stylophora pistillata]|uniref:Protocadherin Fat 3 n=1 Tax=Stylophora pistillata TaxID=50429 RepID=A0A2B4SAP0_STYPI|nr:Protocadherin Fat 3 [Stylophora pistillata]
MQRIHYKIVKTNTTNASPEGGSGQPQSQDDYDFELVFRKTQQMSYVKHDIMDKKWVKDFTVCAWIHTPDIQQSQSMTVISILTEKNGRNQKVLRVGIDGEGKTYFSIGDDWTAPSNVFATSSPKDQLVFLCVRIQRNQSPYMEVIVNADFSSKKSSDGVRNENVQWTQVIIGQNQDIDGTLITDFPFYGRISNLNIWFNSFTDDHITNWFNSGPKHYKPNILKWPDLGSSSKRFGDVHFVKVTSAERQWRDVSESDVYVQSTTDVAATKTVESGSGVVIEVERQSLLPCTGIDLTDSPTVDGVFISKIHVSKADTPNHTFPDTEHEEEKASSVFECVTRCLSTFDCKSINYKKSSSEDNCFLNKMNRREAGEAAIKTDKEFEHYDLSYHIQRSEEAEFGTTDNMPTVPPVVQGPCHFEPCENGGTCIEIASNRTYRCQCADKFYGKRCRQIVTYCNANPCKNGGTCVEAPSAQTYTCNCTDSFSGTNCSESIAEEQNMDYNTAPTVASLNRGNGEPFNQNDYDFELVFRKTQQTNYVKHDMNKNWVEHFTVCAWIHTPDMQQDQNMTVISILTEKNGGNRNVMTVRIDGKGKIYFSIGSDCDLKHYYPDILKWPDVGSSSKRFGDVHFVKVTSAKRQWRDVSESDVNVQSTTDVAATKTVESGSGVVIEVERQSPRPCTGINAIDSPTVDGVFISVSGGWKRIKYKQKASGNYTPGVSEFDLDLDELWKEEYLRPDGNHFDGVNALCGNDHFWMVNHPNTPVAGVILRRKGINCSDPKPVEQNKDDDATQWRNISDGELDVQNTTNVLATKTVESGSGVVIEVESQSPVSCIGSDGIDSATVDGVFISVPGSWKRISYKQTFLETQKCFAFFGSVPNWATGIFTPGVSEFDLSLDELWKEEYLGPNADTSLAAGNGKPENQDYYDFDLVFRKTQQMNYVTHSLNLMWITHFTVCAWMNTPGVKQNKTPMSIISVLTRLDDGSYKVLTVQIDGQGTVYFSYGNDRTTLSNVFTTSFPKDQMVFFCVRVQTHSPYMDVVVNADFNSKISSDDVKYHNAEWSQVILGQNQEADGTIRNDSSFDGRISDVNIWQGILDESDTKNWYNSGLENQYYKPDIIKWPEFGSVNKRFGDVHFVKVTSARRHWRNVSNDEVGVQTTGGVSAPKSFENGSGVIIEVEHDSPVSCSDGSDSATVDGVFITVNGNWKRIAYKQTFLETQKCFAIFGSVPDWATSIFTPGVSELNLDLDELWTLNLGQKVCDTNPCKNGGTCVAAPSAKIYKCNCTDTFTGINCSEPKPVVQKTDDNVTREATGIFTPGVSELNLIWMSFGHKI